MPNTTVSAGPGVTYDEHYEPKLDWMDSKGQWGMKAEPGKHGLTLEDIQMDSYGEAPESSSIRSGRQRGSAAPGVELPERRVLCQLQAGRLAQERRRPLRRGPAKAVELGYRHPMGNDQTPSR